MKSKRQYKLEALKRELERRKLFADIEEDAKVDKVKSIEQKLNRVMSEIENEKNNKGKWKLRV